MTSSGKENNHLFKVQREDCGEFFTLVQREHRLFTKIEERNMKIRIKESQVQDTLKINVKESEDHYFQVQEIKESEDQKRVQDQGESH